jgi:hypothetical protein
MWNDAFKDWANRLHPCSPEYVRVVLLAELDQAGGSRAWGRTVVYGERHDEQNHASYTAQPLRRQ